ncbi:MAG: hypothetical protein KKD39_08910 [Candidatus Altiarchaeota archaeon]|nr:hypothetical protein [Candidatus Altiarchaeota archaeon]
MEVCIRCGADQLQDLRTWKYLRDMGKYLCPICVFQGATEENHSLV